MTVVLALDQKDAVRPAAILHRTSIACFAAILRSFSEYSTAQVSPSRRATRTRALTAPATSVEPPRIPLRNRSYGSWPEPEPGSPAPPPGPCARSPSADDGLPGWPQTTAVANNGYILYPLPHYQPECVHNRRLVRGQGNGVPVPRNLIVPQHAWPQRKTRDRPRILALIEGTSQDPRSVVRRPSISDTCVTLPNARDNREEATNTPEHGPQSPNWAV